jgi:8-oxo-dGTP pyrophosphatase MutT (NUDIX family)
MADASNSVHQAAAVPFQAGRVCLITSRRGRRWVIPKGCLEAHKTPAQIALQEAWEEAGLKGILSRAPVGTYRYEKWDRIYLVTVFVMQVTEVAVDWPEMELRQRRWLRPARALARIKEPELRRLLNRILTAIDVESPTLFAGSLVE